MAARMTIRRRSSHCCAAQHVGNATDQLYAAMLLLYGENIEHDPAHAVRLLAQSAEVDQPAAMYHLGELLRRGHGVALRDALDDQAHQTTSSRGC
jgi:TPR repeat protein